MHERDDTPSPDPRSDDDVAGMVFLWHCEESCCYHLSIGGEVAIFTLDQFIAFANMVVDCYLDHGMQGAQSINLLGKIMSLYPPNISSN